MCRTAQINKLSTPGSAYNCNIPPDIEHNPAINLQQYASDKKWQFIAQEDKPFRLNVSNSQYVFMTTLRHPMDRLVSHIHHAFCAPDGPARLQARGCEGRADITLSDLVIDPCFGARAMRAITTDYYVSMLTGCDSRFFDGKDFLSPNEFTCGEVHLEKAKRMLHYFSVIMISDDSIGFDKYATLLDLKFSITFKEQYRTGTHVNSGDVVHEVLK
jgi:hypothetical protein